MVRRSLIALALVGGLTTSFGFTPLSEAVVQVRGQGGARQVPRNDHVLVSGNGGILHFHSTMTLNRYPST